MCVVDLCAGKCARMEADMAAPALTYEALMQKLDEEGLAKCQEWLPMMLHPSEEAVQALRDGIKQFRGDGECKIAETALMLLDRIDAVLGMFKSIMGVSASTQQGFRERNAALCARLGLPPQQGSFVSLEPSLMKLRGERMHLGALLDVYLREQPCCDRWMRDARVAYGLLALVSTPPDM